MGNVYTDDSVSFGVQNLFVLKTKTDNAYLDTLNGNVKSYNGYITSDYIDVMGNTQFVLQNWKDTISSVQSWIGICYYDSSKTFISGEQEKTNSTNGKIVKKYTIPENTKYIRVYYQTNNSTYYKCESGNVATNYNRAIEDIIG